MTKTRECEWCRQSVAAEQPFCPSCGTPVVTALEREMLDLDLGRRKGGLLRALICALVLVAVAGVRWGGPCLKALSVAAFAGGLFFWIIHVLWRRRFRRPLRLRPYGELRYLDRPVAYHLSTFGLVFALAMIALAVLFSAFGSAFRA